MNKITLRIRVGVDDWTTKMAIFVSNGFYVNVTNMGQPLQNRAYQIIMGI